MHRALFIAASVVASCVVTSCAASPSASQTAGPATTAGPGDSAAITTTNATSTAAEPAPTVPEASKATTSTAPATSTAAPSNVVAANFQAVGAGPMPAMTLLAADGTIIMFDADGRGVTLHGILTQDSRFVVTASPRVGAPQPATLVTWRAVPTGEADVTFQVDGALVASAVSSDGQQVALTSAARAGSAAQTTIAVVDRTAGQLGRWRAGGNLVPEAFGNAFDPANHGLPTGLFVIEYLSPGAYRVRVLDTASGQLGLPLNLRDKTESVDEVINAVSRTAVTAPVDQLLFTLFQGSEDGEMGPGAFIHTLGLYNGVWCLAVPDELDLGSRTGALAVRPQGGRLFAASPNGKIAAYTIADIIDSSRQPAADRIAEVGAAGSRVSIDAGTDTVVAAIDSRVMRLDPSTLQVTDSFTWDMTVEALATVPDAVSADIGAGDVIIVGSGRITRVSGDHQLVAERYLPNGGAEITRVILTPTR